MRSVFALCATVRRIAKFIALLYIVVPNLSRCTRGQSVNKLNVTLYIFISINLHFVILLVLALVHCVM